MRPALIASASLIVFFLSSGCAQRLPIVRENFDLECAEVARQTCVITAQWVVSGDEAGDWDSLIVETIPTLMQDFRTCAMIARARSECLERGESGNAICGYKRSCPETE